MQAFAEYNEYGYRIFFLDKDGDFLDELTVECGNCSLESTTVVSLNDASCLPLKTIKKYVLSTLEECCKEHNVTFNKWSLHYEEPDSEFMEKVIT